MSRRIEEYSGKAQGTDILPEMEQKGRSPSEWKC